MRISRKKKPPDNIRGFFISDYILPLKASDLHATTFSNDPGASDENADE
jgi:hypothetical protein